MPKVSALMSSIRAGEDTELELKEVVFRGDRVSFASEEDRAAPKLAEVFVSMANTSYQPVRRNQLLAGFMRDYKSTVTGGSFMEARGEGFLNLVRDSLRLSGRRPELEQIGDATKLTIYAAQYPEDVTGLPSLHPGKP